MQENPSGHCLQQKQSLWSPEQNILLPSHRAWERECRNRCTHMRWLLSAVTSRGWNLSLPSLTAVSTKQWISFSFHVIMISCLGKTEKSQTTAVATDKYKTGLKFGSSVKCLFNNKAVFKMTECRRLDLIVSTDYSAVSQIIHNNTRWAASCWKKILLLWSPFYSWHKVTLKAYFYPAYMQSSWSLCHWRWN